MDIQTLRAVAIATADNDVRTWLNGVRIEQGRMVATDGHRMHVAKIEYDGQAVTMPIKIVRDIVKIAKKGDFEIECLTPRFKGDDAVIWQAKVKGFKMEFSPPKGTFPDWRKVIRTPTGEPAQYNPRFLRDVQLAAEILAGRKLIHDPNITVFPSGDMAGLVLADGEPGFAAVVMPWMVDSELKPSRAAWLEEHPAEPATDQPV